MPWPKKILLPIITTRCKKLKSKYQINITLKKIGHSVDDADDSVSMTASFAIYSTLKFMMSSQGVVQL